jgi:hypothetical protein
LLVALLEADEQIQVVGQVKSGVEAGSMTKRLGAQVVTMGFLVRSSNLQQHADGPETKRLSTVESPTPLAVALHGAPLGSAAQELSAAGVVFTPCVASEAGLADNIVPVDAIADRILVLLARGTARFDELVRQKEQR